MVFVVLNLSFFSYLKSFGDFDASMICRQEDKAYYNKLINNLIDPFKKYYATLKHNYNDFIKRFDAHKPYNSIPKVIHQIWLGNKPIPKQFFPFMESWKKYHPDWEYILWTDKDVKNLDLITQKYFDQETHPRSRANILRFELLYKFGGLYVDLDFECLAPLKMHDYCNFYAGILELPRTVFNLQSQPDNLCRFRSANALVGTTPEHPILHHFLVNLIPQCRQYHDILMRTGVKCFNRALWDMADSFDESVVLFPSNFFFSWYRIKPGVSVNSMICKIMPETMAVHWYFSK